MALSSCFSLQEGGESSPTIVSSQPNSCPISICSPSPKTCPRPLSLQLGRSNTNLHRPSCQQPAHSQDHTCTCSCPECSCSAARTHRDLARNTHPPLLGRKVTWLSHQTAVRSVPHCGPHPRIPSKNKNNSWCPPSKESPIHRNWQQLQQRVSLDSTRE